jgi:hypothetical protein
MTDALGEWTLKQFELNRSDWKDLLRIKKNCDLKQIVERERRKENLRVDDTTLIVIEF